MKKILNVITVVLFIIGLVGCKAQETPETDCGTSQDTHNLCTRPLGTDESEEVNREGLDEYVGLSENSVLQTIYFEEAKALIEGGTGVLALGFPSCQWCQEAFPILDNVASDLNVNNVYYLNVRGLTRGEEDTEYEQIADLLQDYMGTNEEGEMVIYVPDVFFIKDGEVIAHHLGTTEDHDAHERQMTEDEIEELTNTYINMFNLLK